MIFLIIKELTKKAGIKKNNFTTYISSQLCHAFGRRGANLRAVQEMLGHENITTPDIYTS
jgi:Site-specific recombinase XerD